MPGWVIGLLLLIFIGSFVAVISFVMFTFIKTNPSLEDTEDTNTSTGALSYMRSGSALVDKTEQYYITNTVPRDFVNIGQIGILIKTSDKDLFKFETNDGISYSDNKWVWSFPYLVYGKKRGDTKNLYRLTTNTKGQNPSNIVRICIPQGIQNRFARVPEGADKIEQYTIVAAGISDGDQDNQTNSPALVYIVPTDDYLPKLAFLSKDTSTTEIATKNSSITGYKWLLPSYQLKFSEAINTTFIDSEENYYIGSECPQDMTEICDIFINIKTGEGSTFKRYSISTGDTQGFEWKLAKLCKGRLRTDHNSLYGFLKRGTSYSSSSITEYDDISAVPITIRLQNCAVDVTNTNTGFFDCESVQMIDARIAHYTIAQYDEWKPFITGIMFPLGIAPFTANIRTASATMNRVVSGNSINVPVTTTLLSFKPCSNADVVAPPNYVKKNAYYYLLGNKWAPQSATCPPGFTSIQGSNTDPSIKNSFGIIVNSENIQPFKTGELQKQSNSDGNTTWRWAWPSLCKGRLKTSDTNLYGFTPTMINQVRNQNSPYGQAGFVVRNDSGTDNLIKNIVDMGPIAISQHGTYRKPFITDAKDSVWALNNDSQGMGLLLHTGGQPNAGLHIQGKDDYGPSPAFNRGGLFNCEINYGIPTCVEPQRCANGSCAENELKSGYSRWIDISIVPNT